MWTNMKLAWRNLFRNKRRTFIAGSAIGIGLAALIFTDGLMIGMKNNLINSATASFLGEGQIHRKEFRRNADVNLTITDGNAILADLAEEPLVEHTAPRTMTFGMITSPANVSAISMFGVDPKVEPYLSQIDEAIIEGDYFKDATGHEILIGSKLAEILEVGLGDRVVMTVAQAHTGELSQELFRVSGIFHFHVREMDRSMAFVRLDKSQQMLNIDSAFHEIAMKFTNIDFSSDTDNPFWKKYSGKDNEALGWPTLLPQLKAAFDMSQYTMFLIGLILFAVVALGIINTLFMSMHERMFEFGVLRAVGTRPLIMGRLIMLEAGALAIISIVFGIIIGFVASSIATKVGFDYQGIEFVGAYFREMLYPVMQLEQYIYYPIYVFIFTMIIGLYPAAHAARLSPAEAMRKA